MKFSFKTIVELIILVIITGLFLGHLFIPQTVSYVFDSAKSVGNKVVVVSSKLFSIDNAADYYRRAGKRVYYPEEKDALHRLNSYMMAPAHASQETTALVSELVEFNVPVIEKLRPAFEIRKCVFENDTNPYEWVPQLNKIKNLGYAMLVIGNYYEVQGNNERAVNYYLDAYQFSTQLFYSNSAFSKRAALDIRSLSLVSITRISQSRVLDHYQVDEITQRFSEWPLNFSPSRFVSNSVDRYRENCAVLLNEVMSLTELNEDQSIAMKEAFAQRRDFFSARYFGLIEDYLITGDDLALVTLINQNQDLQTSTRALQHVWEPKGIVLSFKHDIEAALSSDRTELYTAIATLLSKYMMSIEMRAEYGRLYYQYYSTQAYAKTLDGILDYYFTNIGPANTEED